jgi:hypothetical protein
MDAAAMARIVIVKAGLEMVFYDFPALALADFKAILL